VSQSLIVQGRPLDRSELENLRQWVGDHPDWSRRRLSLELATRWDWRNGAGQLKDMATRTLLLKLDQRGLIQLPARRQIPTNRMRCRSPELGLEQAELAPMACALPELGTLQVREVSAQTAERVWIKTALSQFHYLGFGGTVGQNLQYVVQDSQERRLACLVFGAAAWQCQDRDRFIGWSAEQRQRNLALIANNTRFLVLPSVQVPGLGSWILGQVRRRIAGDWQAKYGQGIVLLESFVERPRFAGAVYRAANWQRVGVTAGRTRQDRHTCLQVPIKDIYLDPLSGSFREALQA
jgi:hypothetical protein